VTKKEQTTFFGWSLAATIVLGISAAVALILTFATDEFRLNLTAISDFRTGTIPDDDYPARPVLASAGTTNVPALISFVGVFSFLGFLVLTIANKREVDQMSSGASPFYWFSAMLWHFVVFLEIAFFAGATNWVLLMFLATIVEGWLGFFWVNDVLQSPFYLRAAMRNAGSNRMAMGWQWLAWFFGLFGAIVVYVAIIVYMVFTFGQAPTAPTTWFLIVPIVGLVLYLFVPVVVIMRYFNVAFHSVYSRNITLVVYTFFFALIMVWFPLIVTTIGN
jgi:hypothetical protein